MTTALEGGEGSASRPGHSLPPGNTRYPLYRRLGGPQGRSGQVQKISPPPGFNPQTTQPIASHYTDYATLPTFCGWFGKNLMPMWGGKPHLFCCPDHTLVVMVTDFFLYKQNCYDNLCLCSAELQCAEASILML